jgi:hypothetical protein
MDTLPLTSCTFSGQQELRRECDRSLTPEQF